MAEERELFKAAVFIVIRDKKARVLLQRRANTGFMDGYYDFPSGHVDADESFAEAAVRELAEETGLKVNEAEFEVLHINQNYLRYPYINITFIAKKWSGTPVVMEPAKCDDQQFFPVDALPEQCTLAVRYVARAGWTDGPHLSKTTPDTFQTLIGVPYSEIMTGRE